MRLNRRDDSGMTLVELLLSMSMVTVIISAISGAYIAFLSNAAETTARDDHSGGMALLTSYLDRDLASAAALPSTPSCVTAGATLKLHLSWTEYTATAASPSPVPAGTWHVTYSVAADPDGTPVAGPARYKLVRSICAPSVSQQTDTLVSGLGSAGVIVQATPNCRGADTTRVDVTVPSYSTDSTEPYHYVGCVNGRLS